VHPDGEGEEKGGEEEQEGENGSVTSPLANTGSSYHNMQPTKHEHSKPDYL
jgi:hypothetical protein